MIVDFKKDLLSIHATRALNLWLLEILPHYVENYSILTRCFRRRYREGRIRAFRGDRGNDPALHRFLWALPPNLRFVLWCLRLADCKNLARNCPFFYPSDVIEDRLGGILSGEKCANNAAEV